MTIKQELCSLYHITGIDIKVSQREERYRILWVSVTGWVIHDGSLLILI